MNLLKLFCDVDDFCLRFIPVLDRYLLVSGIKKRNRRGRLALSEVMTIIICFHRSRYRNFKHYYQNYVCRHLCKEFPGLVSYQRFVELMPATLIPLCAFLNGSKGKVTGISFIDSTPIVVCHNRRIHSHKVFKNMANRGKSSMGWFFGFKLHLIINEHGELLAFKVTAGNVDDRKPVMNLTRDLFGKLFGDKGYISQALFEKLFDNSVQLITRIRKNMKNKLMPLFDKILLRKRSLIETVNDQLKNISQIEHTRHRSLANFMVNLISGLIAYTYQKKKPSLKLTPEELNLLTDQPAIQNLPILL